MLIFYIFAAWQTCTHIGVAQAVLPRVREFAARESVSFELFKSSALAMPGREERERIVLPKPLYIMCTSILRRRVQRTSAEVLRN